ncbi:hypothetical protein CSC37_4028 [Escherichia coli]|nr:hypothetical protein CSC37_4028 [Escherichia coli]
MRVFSLSMTLQCQMGFIFTLCYRGVRGATAANVRLYCHLTV